MIGEGWQRLRRFWRPSVRDEVGDEVAFHLEMRVAEFIAAGLSRDAAEAKARAQFGDIANVSDTLIRIDKRSRRDLDIADHIDAIVMDLHAAARVLSSKWVSSALAILMLSVGIGASVAVFSAVDAVLIRPLPFPRA